MGDSSSLDSTNSDTTTDTVSLHPSKSRQTAPLTQQQGAQALVEPLISIIVEEEVVEKSRIAAAQAVLHQEEALYGRVETFTAAQAYLSKLSVHQESSNDQQEESQLGIHAEDPQMTKHGTNSTLLEAITLQATIIGKSKGKVMQLENELTRVRHLHSDMLGQVSK
jgi:hypothetical protein